MIALQDRYTFEAELDDGSTINAGGDLRWAVRVSLIPAISWLPRHDLVRQQFVRRFMRGFKRATVGGFDREAYFAEMERNITKQRIIARAARQAKGLTPETFPTEPLSSKARGDEYVQVVCMKDYRIYVRHTDGSALMTPPDYELYL